MTGHHMQLKGSAWTTDTRVMRFFFGYLDAGSGALLLQLLVGGVAGIGALLRFRWRSLTGRGIADEGEATAPVTAENSSDLRSD